MKTWKKISTTIGRAAGPNPGKTPPTGEQFEELIQVFNFTAEELGVERDDRLKGLLDGPCSRCGAMFEGRMRMGMSQKELAEKLYQANMPPKPLSEMADWLDTPEGRDWFMNPIVGWDENGAPIRSPLNSSAITTGVIDASRIKIICSRCGLSIEKCQCPKPKSPSVPPVPLGKRVLEAIQRIIFTVRPDADYDGLARQSADSNSHQRGRNERTNRH